MLNLRHPPDGPLTDELVNELLVHYLEDTDPHGDLARPIQLEGIKFGPLAVANFLRWALGRIEEWNEPRPARLGPHAARLIGVVQAQAEEEGLRVAKTSSAHGWAATYLETHCGRRRLVVRIAEQVNEAGRLAEIPQLGEAASAEVVRAIGENVAERYGPEKDTGADPSRVLGRVLDDLKGGDRGDS